MYSSKCTYLKLTGFFVYSELQEGLYVLDLQEGLYSVPRGTYKGLCGTYKPIRKNVQEDRFGEEAVHSSCTLLSCEYLS